MLISQEGELTLIETPSLLPGFKRGRGGVGWKKILVNPQQGKKKKKDTVMFCHAAKQTKKNPTYVLNYTEIYSSM